MPKDARDSAALLASKIYYYLSEYDEALSFALGAGSAFEAESRLSGSEEYVETVVCEPNFLLPIDIVGPKVLFQQKPLTGIYGQG